MRPLICVLLLALTLSSARAGRPPVHWLIFVDDLHLRFVETGRLRQVLGAVGAELVGPGDHCTIRCSGPSCGPGGADTPPDCAAFVQWRRATGNGLREDDVVREAGRASVRRELEFRARTALAVVRQLLEAGSARPGQPMLLYVSNGYFAASGADARLSMLADAAIASGIRVFPIDIRPVEFDASRYPQLSLDEWRNVLSETRGSLESLATRTDCRAVSDPLGGGLAAIGALVR